VVKRELLLNKTDDRDFISIRVSRETYGYLNSLKLRIAHELQDRGYYYNVSFDDAIQDLLIKSKYDLKTLNDEVR